VLWGGGAYAREREYNDQASLIICQQRQGASCHQPVPAATRGKGGEPQMISDDVKFQKFLGDTSSLIRQVVRKEVSSETPNFEESLDSALIAELAC